MVTGHGCRKLPQPSEVGGRGGSLISSALQLKQGGVSLTFRREGGREFLDLGPKRGYKVYAPSKTC